MRGLIQTANRSDTLVWSVTMDIDSNTWVSKQVTFMPETRRGTVGLASIFFSLFFLELRFALRDFSLFFTRKNGISHAAVKVVCRGLDTDVYVAQI